MDPEVLHQALIDLVARHHALRGRPVRRGDGRYEVEILAEVPVTLPIADLRAHAGEAERVDHWCREQASTPFTLDQAPLFRFRLARLAEDHWVMVTVFHHAVCDGWSLSLIRRDLGELYNARRSGTDPQLPVTVAQFTDFARSEHALPDERRTVLERFWRTELDTIPLRPPLPYDHPHPGKLSGRGALHTWTIADDTPARLTSTATRLGVTAYTVLAAAFATWLGDLCGEENDIVLAASSANRVQRGRSPFPPRAWPATSSTS
ncbi:condensation domain-containing protein [Streptomyces azureus]|uniref:Condensation domain-containing protein n=1 Tax=Streptomyces azureus TaxID=146537 RepID=A0A0K8PHC1_STRAJ|nr:condensation domain-containing protein [Streptomyces azureus]GAP47123.1 predicted protein [Streptomyces azureus]